MPDKQQSMDSVQGRADENPKYDTLGFSENQCKFPDPEMMNPVGGSSSHPDFSQQIENYLECLAKCVVDDAFDTESNSLQDYDALAEINDEGAVGRFISYMQSYLDSHHFIVRPETKGMAVEKIVSKYGSAMPALATLTATDNSYHMLAGAMVEHCHLNVLHPGVNMSAAAFISVVRQRGYDVVRFLNAVRRELGNIRNTAERACTQAYIIREYGGSMPCLLQL